MEMIVFIAVLMSVAAFGYLYLARAQHIAATQRVSSHPAPSTPPSSPRSTDAGLDLMSMLGGIHEYVETGVGPYELITTTRETWRKRRNELEGLGYSPVLLDDIDTHLRLGEAYESAVASSFADDSGQSEAAAATLAQQLSCRSPVLVGRVSHHLGSKPSSHRLPDTGAVGAL